MSRNQTAAIHEDKAQMKNVRDAVRIHRYEVTVGDVISETGLGDHEAEEALNDLMRTHACTLRVSEGGDLIYAFENGLAARKPPSWFHRHAWTIANAAKTAFQFLFMLVFVFYTAIATLFIGLFAFALLLITIPIWLPIWILKSIILYIFSEDHGILFRVLSRFAASRYQIDLENVLSFKYILKSIWMFFVGSSEEDKKYLPLHQRLSNFVFGPSEKSFARDERAACARLIHAQKGVITAEDWIFITGKSLKEAQSDLSMFTAEFGGKAEITKNGTLIYVFEKMMRTTDDVVSNPPSPVWESPAPRLPLTGNNSGKAGIVFISVIMFLIYGCYSFILMNQLNITSISFIMTFVSFVFYMTVFLFPLVRLPRNIKINHQRFAQTVKSGLLATLYSLSHPLKDHLLITYNDLDHAVDPFITMQDHDAHTSHALKLKALNEGITFLKENLGGRSSDDASAHSATIYDFDLMHTHLADAQEARTRLALRCQVTDGAQLAFSTDQEEQEKIDTREEKEEIASFDRKLIPDTGVSSLKESDSHDANDLKYTPPCTDKELKFKQFTENRERICHQLEQAIQNKNYTKSDEIISEYPPELMEDEAYAELARACNRGQKMAGIKSKVEDYFDFDLFEIECPKTLVATGIADVLFALGSFASESSTDPRYGILWVVVFVINFLVTFLICTDISFNPLKNVDDDERWKSCIGLWFLFFIGGAILVGAITDPLPT